MRQTMGKETGGSVCETKQAGELMKWVNPVVWTERMLEALLKGGVKGGKWFSLIDKVYKPGTLKSAFDTVKGRKGAAGVDHITVDRFEANLSEQLAKLEKALKEGTYQPQNIRRVYIEKSGTKAKRPLGIPTVRDRVVQTALKNVIEPIFENEFKPCSFGFRPGKGCKDALREVDALLKQGHCYVLDADIKEFFDSIDHDIMLKKIEGKIADKRILELIRQFLKAGVLEEGKERNPHTGTPQGGVISPILANIYLHELDEKMMGAGLAMIRYADDLVVLAKTEQEAKEARKLLEATCEGLKLTLHPEKTRLVNMMETRAEFDFLGYRFYRSSKGKLTRLVRKKSLKKFRATIKRHTRRLTGHSMETVIKRVNMVLRGWFNYFKHSNKTIFDEQDAWVRKRIRGILRRRSKRKGITQGHDHYRWPNRYVHGTLGLLNLKELYREAFQSACR